MMANGDLVFSHITTFLNFDTDPTKKKLFLLAIKDTLSDLSFIYSDFLSFYIKKEYPVVIVNLAQSFHHYNKIMLKTGINMKSLREQEKIISIDVLSNAENLINKSSIEMENVQTLSSVVTDSSDTYCLKPLFEHIQKSIKVVLKSKPERFLLLIDEMNVFINLGVPFKAIQPFVQSCYSFCVSAAETPGMLLMGCLQDKNDTESLKVVNYLSHICDVELAIEGLKTGYSKDTQGKISFETRNKATGVYMSRKLFFKVEDKGAKIFH